MVEFHGIYTIHDKFKVIYLSQPIFYKLMYSIRAGKKVFFVTIDDREQLISPQQIKYWILQIQQNKQNQNQQNIQNRQYQQRQQCSLIPIRIEPFFFYTDRVSIEEYRDKIVFRDLKTIPIWAILNYNQNEAKDLELPPEPEITPGSTIEVKAPRRGRKAFLEVWED